MFDSHILTKLLKGRIAKTKAKLIALLASEKKAKQATEMEITKLKTSVNEDDPAVVQPRQRIVLNKQNDDNQQILSMIECRESLQNLKQQARRLLKGKSLSLKVFPFSFHVLYFISFVLIFY